MYTSFINEPSEIRSYDLRCHIDVQPGAVLLLQWIGNWLGGFFNHYLSSKKTWISTRAVLFGVIALDSRSCLVQPKALILLISPICAFEVFLKGDNLWFKCEQKKKRTDPLLNVKTSQPVRAVRLTDRSFKTRRQTTTAPKLLMLQRRW